MHLNLEIDANISEVHCNDFDLRQESTLKKAEKQNDQEVTRMLENMLETVQTKRADVLGFGQEIHRQAPDYWQNVDDWPEEFSDLQIEFSVQTNIKGIGEIDNSFNVQEHENGGST
nr:Ger(x)C family spore germination C-terminal domain-containing protein [Salicibibacter halophilus]